MRGAVSMALAYNQVKDQTFSFTVGRTVELLCNLLGMIGFSRK